MTLDQSTIEKETGVYKSFDGTPIYYEVRGEGEPLIFVYGIACLMNHWHHQITHFSKSFKVISYDLRGHHKSTPVANLENLNIESLAKDLIGLIHHLGLKSAHVAGHSFGVPVIIEAFKQDPSVIKSMVLINGFAKNPIKGMFGLDVMEPFFYYVKAQYDLNPDLWNNLWKIAVYNPISMRMAALAGGFNLRLTHFKDIEVYTRGVAQMDLGMFLPMFESMMKFNGDDILETINKPTLIISGEDDKVTPKSFQHEFHQKIKGSEFVSVPYGSHCTQLDFPDYVNLKMQDFILRHK